MESQIVAFTGPGNGLPFSTKQLPEPMLSFCQLEHQEHISMSFISSSNIFIQENASEIIISLQNGGHFIQVSMKFSDIWPGYPNDVLNHLQIKLTQHGWLTGWQDDGQRWF